MSDLKKVLKAGLLVTASLFATGCGDDNTKDTPANGGGSSGGGSNNGGGSSGGGSSTKAQSSVSTFSLGLGELKSALSDLLPAYKIPSGGDTGYGADYDIFDKLQPQGSAVQNSGDPRSKDRPVDGALVEILDHVSPSGESFKLDFTNASKFPVDKNNSPTKIGGLLLDGKVDKNRSTVVASVNTDGKREVQTNLIVLRSAVLTAGANDATISTPYAYVGIDSAIGYTTAREDKEGKPIVLPVTIHAEPTASTSQLSAGDATTTTPKKSTLAPTGAAATSKAKPATKVTVNTANLADAAMHSEKTNSGKKLTLKMTNPSNDQPRILKAAGLSLVDNKGTLDVGGRIAIVDASNVVISAINAAEPELKVAEGEKTKLAAEPAAKPVGPTETKTAAAKKPRGTATAASTKAKSDATKDKEAVAQGTAKKADGTIGFYDIVKPAELKDGNVTGLYAQIGELTVGEGVVFQAIPHHTLVVRKLNLKKDLRVDVLVQNQHDGVSLTKLNALKWDEVSQKNGKDLMTALSETEKHPISEYGLSGDKGEAYYYHYDSNTPFPLWIGENVNSNNHQLTFGQLNLASDVKLEAGVYVYPLVKDLTETLPDNVSTGAAKITLATDGSAVTTHEVANWKIIRNGHRDVLLVLNVTEKASLALSAGIFERALMSSKAQSGRSVPTATLDAVVAKLDPTNLVATSFANHSSARLNQASQIASLARGVNATSAEKLGAVEQYAVTFNHAGAQFGLTYNLDGGNAFSSNQGTTSFGANVASDVLGLKAIVSAEASVDAGKNAYASSSLASYNAGVTFAKAYSFGGLSVVPMGGFGVSSNALNSYSAVVPMAVSSLGLYMNDVSFTAATFNAGVNVTLDDFVAATAGVKASLTLGVAGYLASTANATLSTSEGKSSNLQFGGDAVTPYAQFNLGFATGEKLNTMISSEIAAVNFGLDR